MKKKHILRIASMAIGLTMAVGLVCGSLTACGGKGGDRPLVLSSEQPDGVFNPFFYTSGADGDVVGMTQIGMLSTDKNGEIVSGADEPCVAIAHSVVTTGSREDQSNPDDYSNYYTDYYFAIKDDIKFSDGTPLTMKDVLFNIYMYLDPAYTGSATMYSVDIQGLQAYRTQTADENEQQGFETLISDRVLARVQKITDWAKDTEQDFDDLDETSRDDLDKIDELFKEEVASDWNTYMTADLKDYDKYVDENGNKIYTENWQVFLSAYGAFTTELQTNADKTKKWYTYENNVPDSVAKTKEALTEYVFGFMLSRSQLKTYKTNVSQIITYYATANTFRQYLRGQVIKDILAERGGILYKTISGITAEHGTTIPGENGELKQLGKECDILHIRINGEDPKAIQNFGFTVAPMNYYTAPWRKAHPGTKEFSTDAGNEYYGVEFADSEFMDSIRYIQVPMGAGPYRATTVNGSDAANIANVSKSAFFSDNIVYLESNENFFLGAPKIKLLRYKVVSSSLLYDAVLNGEINYASPSGTMEVLNNLQHKDNKKLDYTLTENLGYGYIGINASYVHDLNIRKAIMYAMDTQLCIDYYGSDTLASAIYRPMSKVLWCYPEDSKPYYPFSENLTDPSKPYNAVTNPADGHKSLELAQEAGYYVGSDGKLVNGNGDRLKFTFTFAGDSTDHPAYNCMNKAAEILNNIGFDVTVTRDSTALSKLAAGRLEVWAAAWSSSSDPDMYQVYHKDSSATSILAWGFPWIKTATSADGTTVTEQKELLDELAVRIEEGRETTDKDERTQIYSVSTGSDMGSLCALDLVMELAVELPTYQRGALYVYQKGLFSEESLAKFFKEKATAFASPLNRIWEIEFAK